MYFLPNSFKVQVCQKLFLNTPGISERAVDVALDNDENNIFADDKRGKHAPKHKTSDEDKKIIDDHIMSFNPSVAHCIWEHAPRRLYLPLEIEWKCIITLQTITHRIPTSSARKTSVSQN